MSDLLDLEISLYRAPGDQYRVQTRLMNPYDEVVPDPVTATLALPEKELEECRALSDWVAYGRVLADFVFRDAGAARYMWKPYGLLESSRLRYGSGC